MKKILVAVGFLLLFIILLVDYHNHYQPGQPLFDRLEKPTATHAIDTLTFSQDRLQLSFVPRHHPKITIAFSQHLEFYKRLRIQVDEIHGVRSILVYYQLAGDTGFVRHQRVQHAITDSTAANYDFLLPPGNYTKLRIDFIGAKASGSAFITDLQLREYSAFFYTESYLYLLVLIILASFILPGGLIYSLFVDREKVKSEDLLLFFFGGSLLFYLLVYAAIEVAHFLQFNAAKVAVTVSFLLLTLLVGALIRTQRWRIFLQTLAQEKRSFILVAIITLVCCLLFTRFVKEPFSFPSINWNTVNGEVTFSKFTGHDNMFQYVNGIAIADNEPFAKYYGDSQLGFGVQDREMLAGIIYGVAITLISVISPYISKSYLTYSLVGLCMNVMVIFPLIVLRRRYFGAGKDLLFVLLISLNTFVLPNYYFTWFKFSGAALFISGLLILLQYRQQTLAWLIAGLAFGLSTNMHAGNALGIPLVFLWLLFLNFREKGLPINKMLWQPILLSSVFILVNLPWALVKSHYYPDQHILLKFHYFPGPISDKGMAETISLFLQAHPLSEQIVYRFTNLFDSLRFEQFAEIYHTLAKDGLLNMFYVWSNSEFLYCSVALYPITLIAFICVLAGKIKAKRGMGVTLPQAGAERGGIAGREALGLLAMALATIVVLILLSYHDYPDANHHLPMGIILVIHALCIGYSLNCGRIGRVLLISYGCLSFWRIGSLFIHFL